MSVELKRKIVKHSRPIANVSRTFTVKEELDVGYGKDSVGAIVRADGACVVTDSKVIANKVILKAELNGHILYTSDNKANNANIMEFTLPISQIVDVEGVDENSQCRLMLNVNGITPEVRANNEGEARVIALAVELCCNAVAYKNNEVPVVTDMYSTKYESTYTAKPVLFERLNAVMENEHTIKNTYEMPNNEIENVLDVWSDVVIKNAKVENNELVVSGTIRTCMLAEQGDGETACVERTGDLEYRARVDNPGENISVNCDALVKDTQYSVIGKDKIEVRSTLFFNVGIFSVGRENVLTEIAVNEKSEKKTEDNAALIIYFAEENESVWDIAKRYNTSAKMIANSNDLSGEIVENQCMLLIPKANAYDEH